MRASLVAQTVKNLPAVQETWVQSWVREITWRWKWQPTPVFLLGEFHGQRSLGSSVHGVAKSWTALTRVQSGLTWCFSDWSLPANSGHTRVIPGLGRSHMPQSNWAPCATTTEPARLKPLLNKKENHQQWEAPARCNGESRHIIMKTQHSHRQINK